MDDLQLIKINIENLLYQYWSLFPEPKETYTEWFYGRKGNRKEKLDEILEVSNANKQQ